MSPAACGRPRAVARRATEARVVLVRDGTDLASWPLTRWGPADLALADSLARLQLEARRVGCSIELRQPGPDVVELLDLVGLGDVVPDGRSVVEMCGKSESCEEAGVEEVVVPHDPVT
jgi:hypothetical protein